MRTQLPYNKGDIETGTTIQIYEHRYQALVRGEIGLWWSLAWSRKKVEPVLTKRIVRWHEVILLDSRKSCMYLLWSILRVPTARSWVISHPMIVLTSSRSFILNSLMSWSFKHSNALRLFDLRTRLSIYIFTIMSSFFHLMVRMYISVLVRVKPIFRKNLINVLF